MLVSSFGLPRPRHCGLAGGSIPVQLDWGASVESLGSSDLEEGPPADRACVGFFRQGREEVRWAEVRSDVSLLPSSVGCWERPRQAALQGGSC